MSDEPHHLAAQLLPDVLAIARAAAAEVLSIYEEGFEVEQKGDMSPLTTADLAAHEIIVTALAELTPAIPVLSEESGDIPYEVRSSWQRYWLIDPLDGTREFIQRNGEFTVNIALIEAGEAVLGVIVVPESGVAYFAAQGGGAARQLAGGAVVPIKTRPFDVNHIVVAVSRSHGSDALQAFVGGLGACRQVALGSSLKFCLVAEGLADLYPRFGLTSQWDTAAAQCIVQQAGGQVMTLNLQPLSYRTRESLLNPHFIVCGDSEYDWRGYLPGKGFPT